MSGVKFLFDNYLDLDTLANSDVSSQQTAFPIENAFNGNRRSKVWRSNGYFNITADNNVLVFRDTNGGSDLVATVTVAEYNSTTDFMTALKAAMEAVGAHTYTITQTSQKKFNISTSHTYLELRFADSATTIEDVIGFDSVTYTGATDYDGDEVVINTSEWLLFDMGIAALPNAFAMTGPRNSPIKLSPSSIVTLKGNFTNPVSWATPAFEMTIDFDDEVMALIVDEAFYSVGLRYWRLEFTDRDNPNGFIEVGAFFLGRWFDHGCPQFPFNSQLIDRTDTVTSEGGQTFSDIKPKTQSYTLQYLNLHKEDIEDFEYWFDRIGTGVPFFISEDTGEAFSTAFQRRLKYVKFDSAPRWTLQSPNNFSMDLTLREEL